MAKKKRGIPGLSYSTKRALGVSKAKSRISRKTGIPMTKSGVQSNEMYLLRPARDV